MLPFRLTPLQRNALIGDVLALGILTVAGFASHRELDAGLRMLTTFLPFLLAWAWVAPWFGLYDRATLTEPRRVWRVPWACSAAIPLGAFLRGLLLNRPILPIFVLVFLGLGGLAFTLWRAAYALWERRRS